MIINIVNKQRAICIEKKYYLNALSKIVQDRYFTNLVKRKFALYNDDISNLEVMVVFVGDRKIKELNKTYRQKDYVTDVLSFIYSEDFGGQLNSSYSTYELGDIVISVPQAKRQAMEQGVDLKEEILRLLIHGLLHLLGYDHELGQKEAKKMRKIENRLFKIVL